MGISSSRRLVNVYQICQDTSRDLLKKRMCIKLFKFEPLFVKNGERVIWNEPDSAGSCTRHLRGDNNSKSRESDRRKMLNKADVYKEETRQW